MNMKIIKKTNGAVTIFLKYCGLLLTTGMFKEPLHRLDGALDPVGGNLNFKYSQCESLLSLKDFNMLLCYGSLKFKSLPVKVQKLSSAMWKAI